MVLAQVRARPGSLISLSILMLLTAALVLPAGAIAAEDELDLSATNAVVVDAETGQVLFDRNMNQAVAPASLTKIFTTIAALESASLDTRMTVDHYDLVGEASIGLLSGQDVSMETLLYGLMLTSGNDAAMTVARSLGNLPGDSPQESVNRFIERANAVSTRLGLETTRLRNPHGLDQAGHVSSAADIAVMTIYGLQNPFFQQLIATPHYSGDGRELYNVNQLLNQYPGLIGGKTGITSNSGHSLMQVAHRDGKTIVVVLLGSTQEDWYADARTLLDLGFAQLAQSPEDESRPVVGLTSGTITVPDLDAPEGVGGNLTVNRLSDTEAVVRSGESNSRAEAMSWQWPLVSVSMMVVALVLALNFPALLGLGALAFQQGSRIRFQAPSIPLFLDPRRVPGRSASPRNRSRNRAEQLPSGSNQHPSREVRPEPSARSHTQRPSRVPSAGSPGPAQIRGDRAVSLARQCRYHAAAEEFQRALQIDPDLDLTMCREFWRMEPMGFIAAARGYMMNGQGNAARRLLTIVQLAYSSNREVANLFERAIATLDGTD